MGRAWELGLPTALGRGSSHAARHAARVIGACRLAKLPEKLKCHFSLTEEGIMPRSLCTAALLMLLSSLVYAQPEPEPFTVPYDWRAQAIADRHTSLLATYDSPDATVAKRGAMPKRVHDAGAWVRRGRGELRASGPVVWTRQTNVARLLEYVEPKSSDT